MNELEATFNLDVWDHGIANERDFYVMVAPANLASFIEALDVRHIAHYVHRADVAA